MKFFMEVVSFNIDPLLKRKMQEYKDINWSEVLREAVENRIAIEEEIRSHDLDLARALKASHEIDLIRKKTTGTWNGAEEIRKWRATHR